MGQSINFKHRSGGKCVIEVQKRQKQGFGVFLPIPHVRQEGTQRQGVAILQLGAMQGPEISGKVGDLCDEGR